MFLFSFWFYRYQSQKPILPEEPTQVRLGGEVASPPYIKGQSQYFELGKVQIESTAIPVKLGKVRVRTRPSPRFFYGDQLQLSGKITSYSAMSFPEIKKVGEEGNPIKKTLFKFRRYLEEIISQTLPEPEAGLLCGILLGSKHALVYEWEEIYKTAGLIHVVVASGYNITVLTRFLGSLTRPLGMGISAITSLLGVLLFTLMLGGEPPIFRAAIMGMITLWGSYLGRPKDALRALFFSALVMMLIDPLVIDSLSFKLSFSAALGLILLATPLQEKFSLLPLKFLGLDEDFFSTVSASLFVFPIISYYFGRISLGSFLVNTLVLWTIPPSMLLGFLTVSFGLLSIRVSQVIGWFSWALLRFFNLTASFFSRFPLAWEGQIPLGTVFAYYFVLGGLCLLPRILSKKERRN